MRRQAEEERARILREADEKAQTILQDAEEKVQALREEAESELRRQTRSDHESVVGKARMEGRHRLLAARWQMIRDAFDRAEERLNELAAGEDYPEILEGLMREAIAGSEAVARVEVAEQDVELCRSILSEVGSDAEAAPRGEQAGTVIAVSPGGRRRVDNSLMTRLRSARRRLAPRVAEVLTSGRVEE